MVVVGACAARAVLGAARRAGGVLGGAGYRAEGGAAGRGQRRLWGGRCVRSWEEGRRERRKKKTKPKRRL